MRALQLRKEADEALWQHDFVRALRMGSYGFLLYGPGSHAWYQLLDRLMPQQSLKTIAAKVGGYRAFRLGAV